MQKTYIIILVQGVITVAALAFAAGVYRESRQAECFSLDRLLDTAYMTQRLNLDPPQAQQFSMRNVQLRDQLSTTCQRNCAARRKLVAAIDAGEATDHEAILKQMCEAYEDGERATLEHIKAVRAILDTQQRETFDQLVGRCLCGGCENGCE